MNAQQAIVAAEKKVSYDVDELFLRILKVERTAERVKDFTSAKEMQNIMTDINAINQSLQQRVITPGGSRPAQSRQWRHIIISYKVIIIWTPSKFLAPKAHLLKSADVATFMGTQIRYVELFK